MIVVREQAMQAKRPIPECWRSIAERSLRATPGNETRFYSGMSVDVIRPSHKLAPFVGQHSSLRVNECNGDPVPQTGPWLQSIVQGYFNYYAVPGNLKSLGVFRDKNRRC